MALRLTSGARTALAGTRGLKDIFNGGVLDIYSGGQPAGADYAETGVKLIRISLISGTSATSGLTFGTAGDGGAGVLPKSNDVWSGVCSVAGVAGYFRLYGTGGTSGSSATERRIDGNVGVSGSDLVLSNTSLVLSATLTIDSFTLTVPASA
jgi:hypothetical protein